MWDEYCSFEERMKQLNRQMAICYGLEREATYCTEQARFALAAANTCLTQLDTKESHKFSDLSNLWRKQAQIDLDLLQNQALPQARRISDAAEAVLTDKGEKHVG